VVVKKSADLVEFKEWRSAENNSKLVSNTPFMDVKLFNG
jgi:hypothetical protein